MPFLQPLFSTDKKPLPVQDYLPDGTLRDMGESYLNRLPDVNESPLTPESFMHRSESSWVDYAVAYGLLYPYVVMVVFGIGLWGFLKYRKFLIRREYRRRAPCPRCGDLLFACSPYCPHCDSVNESAVGVTMWGFSSSRRISRELPSVSNRLRSHRRCPHCADYLIQPKISQSCHSCGRSPFATVEEVHSFDRFIQKRCWWSFTAVFVVGFIPIIGPLLSGGFYKRTLISPYSSYMTVMRDSSLVVFLLVLRYLFRFLPLIGIIGLPLLAFVEDYVYRKMFMMKCRDLLKRGMLGKNS